MLNFDVSKKLEKKLKTLETKNKVLLIIFRKKVREIILNDLDSIDRCKNLRAPLADLKRIHLTDNFILLFKVIKDKNKVLFVDIQHWDKAYN